MQIEYLKYFIQIADAGSISKAADNLFMERSNLSACLSKLEEAVGTKLFERNTKGVVLTLNGQLFYEWMKKTEQGYKELKDKFRMSEADNALDNVYIYATTSLASEANFYVVTELSEQWPNVSVHYSTNTLEHVLDAVNGKTDAIAFVSLHESDFALLENYPNLTYLNLTQIPFGVYAVPNHPLMKSHKTVSLKILQDYHLLQYAPVSEASFFNNFFASCGLEFPEKFSAVTDLLMYQKMLSTGKYISIGLAKPYTPNVLNDFAMVPVREKLICTQAILVTPEALYNKKIKRIVQLYYKFLKLPLPNELE